MSRLKKIKRLKKIRIHREGTDTLVWGALCIAAVGLFLWRCYAAPHIAFWIFIVVVGTIYGIVVNFFRCPIRKFPQEETADAVVAPADGKVVVVEEVMENEYFHEKRLMISIFMSLWNVHANWFPVDGRVLAVHHQDGNFHKAWLPKASAENEHADVLIEAENGQTILCRQVAGAMARRIVTYAKADDDCFIDEHLGFIKFGSRVDIFLPIDCEPLVKLGQTTTGDLTVIAKLKQQ